MGAVCVKIHKTIDVYKEVDVYQKSRRYRYDMITLSC